MKTRRAFVYGILFCLITGTGGAGYSQNNKGIKAYKTWVKTLDGERHKGYLLLADTAFIAITNTHKSTRGEVIKIPVNNIDVLKIRRRGKVLRGAGIGLLSGAVVGFLLGYAGGDDPPCESTEFFDCVFYFQQTAEDKGAATAILLGIPGTIVGALIGTGRKKLRINGQPAVYRLQRPMLRSYSLAWQRE